MEIIGKISKGTKMDQIYISKKRDGMPIGEYVLIKPITIDEKIKIEEKEKQKYYFYGVKESEHIKLKIIKEIFNVISKTNNKIDNVIITGSFLDEGFKFNDIDILIISNSSINHSIINNRLENLTGVKIHLIILTNKELLAGISTDPLYQSMLSKCVSIKRIIFNINNFRDHR
jgi:predicted nucleotidyltransferase